MSHMIPELSRVPLYSSTSTFAFWWKYLSTSTITFEKYSSVSTALLNLSCYTNSQLLIIKQFNIIGFQAKSVKYQITILSKLSQVHKFILWQRIGLKISDEILFKFPFLPQLKMVPIKKSYNMPDEK